MKFLNANDRKIQNDVSDIDAILEQEEMLYAISESIINYRKSNGLSQIELAKKLKVNQTMISKLESGSYNPTFTKLQEMCRELTNSSEMFIEILENIKKAIRRVTEKSYVVETKTKKYIYSEKSNVIDFNKYKSVSMRITVKNGEECYGEYQSKIPAIG